jgi:hypothetical protein
MNARVFAVRSIAIAFGALALAAAPARAQESASLAAPSHVAPAAVVAERAPLPAGPSLDAATVAVRRPAAELPAAPAPARGFDSGTKLMILGGAAILTGIVIGGDAGHAISIGGAVVGLIGLYQYLQ